jgi:hypothetical protein
LPTYTSIHNISSYVNDTPSPCQPPATCGNMVLVGTEMIVGRSAPRALACAGRFVVWVLDPVSLPQRKSGRVG